jgi:DNA-binding CsgD family transcriptional regulator
MSGERSRLDLHEEVLRRRSGQHAAAGLPQPPYHLRQVAMLFLQCRFDPAEIAAVVPPGLTPAKSGWGTIAAYTVAQGWGLAPYTGFFLTAEVEGHDGPDGQPGFYMHSGLYSGVGGRVMQSIYNANLGIGWSRPQVEGKAIAFETGVDAQPLVRMRATIADTPAFPLSGASHYIGRRPSGDGLNSYSVAWSTDWHDVSVDAVDFLPGAAEVLRVVRPLELVWTVWTPAMTMAFTPPLPLGAPDESRVQAARNVGMLSLFSRLGRAAAILDPDGAIRTINAAAEQRIKNGDLAVAEGRLRPVNRQDVHHYERMLSDVGAGASGAVSEPIVLSASDDRSILARAVAVDPGVAGPGQLLVLFDDPIGPAARDPGPTLELLGLTPAEARIASLVGAGRSPREAADALELTVNTVRSALKIAYEKLGISRQSELARIVARLAG